MLSIQDYTPGQTGLGRRDFVQIGLLGPLALSWSAHQQARANPTASQGRFGKAKRCILVFLNGGPSHLDLWDMKPAAPADVRGELTSIATNVSGTRVSELLPMLARCVGKFKIVRSVTHNAPVHTTAVYTMFTGTYHQSPTVDQTCITPEDHPNLGAIVARHLGLAGKLPPFVCLPSLFEAPPVTGIWPGQNAGFLGPRFDPLVPHLGNGVSCKGKRPYVSPDLDDETGEQPMPGKAAKIRISEKQQLVLLEFSRSCTVSKCAARRTTTILLGFQGFWNEEIAVQVGLNRQQVGVWRQRWQDEWEAMCAWECAEPHRLREAILDALADAPRPGAPAKFTAEQVAQIVAVACEPPELSGRPINHWTVWELRDKVLAPNIVETISRAQVDRILQSAALQPHRKKMCTSGHKWR